MHPNLWEKAGRYQLSVFGRKSRHTAKPTGNMYLRFSFFHAEVFMQESFYFSLGELMDCFLSRRRGFPPQLLRFLLIRFSRILQVYSTWRKRRSSAAGGLGGYVHINHRLIHNTAPSSGASRHRVQFLTQLKNSLRTAFFLLLMLRHALWDCFFFCYFLVE